MIGSIRGKVLLKTEKFLIVEAGGVGYKVNMTQEAIASCHNDSEIFIWTYTHIREDSMELYGFKDREELGFFEMLLAVSGIGPKSALGLLGIGSVEKIKKAIGSGDTGYLTKISGVGKKTAERIIIELKDKLDGAGSEILQGEVDALEALEALGYSREDARNALKKTYAENTNGKVKEALKILGNK